MNKFSKNRKICSIGVSVLMMLCSCQHQKPGENHQPNVIIIYVDDLGYGDLSCYGAKAVSTPHVDEMAKQGLLFTDAHCSASTCTPSRYTLLTGRYAFRNDAAILPGDAPLIIAQDQLTIADMFKNAGYTTGVIGKWHLGLGDGQPDWNGEIKPGPLEIGFDYSFIIPATPDRVPTVFVENHKVLNLDPKDPIKINYATKIGEEPDGLSHPELLKVKADTQHSGTIVNGISRIGYMSGGHSAYWKDEDFATVLTQKFNEFISHQSKPFFLYYSLPSIHVPRSPNARFAGATKMGPRGDDIVQMDWMVGQVMESLKQQGLDKNTMVIFTSDNGPVLDDGYADQAAELVGDHQTAGIYKGGKYSAFEGGTRVPTIIWWNGKIKPAKSAALVSQVDFFSSLAHLVGQGALLEDLNLDSRNMMPALSGQDSLGREVMLEESFTLSLRYCNWKYIAPVTKATPDWLAHKDVATGLQKSPQLYDLQNDPKEEHNLAGKFPAKADEMAALMEDILKDR